MSDIYSKFSDIGIYVSGKRPDADGNVKTLCPECSHLRKHKKEPCLSANIRDGRYKCHNCDWKGSVNSSGDTYKPSFMQKEWKPVTHSERAPSDKMYAWFSSQRGLRRETVDKFGVTLHEGYFREVDRYGKETGRKLDAICFNYYEGENVMNVKYRGPNKQFSQVAGGKKILYNLNAIKETEEVLICEGELDCMSWVQAGIEYTTSVPDGAPKEDAEEVSDKKMEYLFTCEDYLKDKKKIYLATDADGPGIRLREELARRLGKHRCWIIHYPEGCKDGNEVLIKHGEEALLKCYKDAVQYPIEGVTTPADYREMLKQIHQHGYPKGMSTGFSDLDNNLSWHPGTLVVVTGIPSHGKSYFMDQIAVRLMVRHDAIYGYYTPENYPPEVHLHQLSEKLVGKRVIPNHNNQMDESELEKSLEFLDAHVKYIMHNDKGLTTVDYLLDKARELVYRYGATHIVIDPWSNISHQYEGGDVAYIANQLVKMHDFVKRYGVTLIIIAHPTKIQRQQQRTTQQPDNKGAAIYEEPTLYDISGAASWYNSADVGIIVYRDFLENNTKIKIQKVRHWWHGKVSATYFQYEGANGRFFQAGEKSPVDPEPIPQFEKPKPITVVPYTHWADDTETEEDDFKAPF